MPADPAAPVTEPRAELVEAGARAIYALTHDDVSEYRNECGLNRSNWERLADAALAAVLPALTLADLPAALLDEHEQQIRAKVAEEIRAIVGPASTYPPESEHARGYRTGVTAAANWTANNGAEWERRNAARGTEGGTR